MTEHESNTEGGSTREATRDHSTGFDCCGIGMRGAMAECPCGSTMRRHPVITSAILAFMGLVVLMVPVGVILGVIAFFRTL